MWSLQARANYGTMIESEVIQRTNIKRILGFMI